MDRLGGRKVEYAAEPDAPTDVVSQHGDRLRPRQVDFDRLAGTTKAVSTHPEASDRRGGAEHVLWSADARQKGHDLADASRRGRIDVDAVIVTHNSAGDLRALIDGPTVSSFDRVVVVDSNSSDDTLEVASGAGLEVVAQPLNKGFAAAANLGARRASGPEFALLNPDIRFAHSEDLGLLRQHLSEPTVAAVAPALVLPGGELQDSARNVPSPRDLVVRRLTGRHPDAIRESAPVDVDWVVGACVVLRRSAFEQIGGFDERYFLYFEDVDLGVRLAAAGYRVRFDPTVLAFHEHAAASRSRLTAPATRHHMRSAMRFYTRHPRFVLGKRR